MVEWLAASLRGHTHLVAVAKIDGRFEDDLIARLDSGVHFHLRAHVARHCHLADPRLAIFEDRDLQAVAVEDDGLGGALSCLDAAR